MHSPGLREYEIRLQLVPMLHGVVSLRECQGCENGQRLQQIQIQAAWEDL
jgi:hypothetical protein